MGTYSSQVQTRTGTELRVAHVAACAVRTSLKGLIRKVQELGRRLHGTPVWTTTATDVS